MASTRRGRKIAGGTRGDRQRARPGPTAHKCRYRAHLGGPCRARPRFHTPTLRERSLKPMGGRSATVCLVPLGLPLSMVSRLWARCGGPRELCASLAAGRGARVERQPGEDNPAFEALATQRDRRRGCPDGLDGGMLGSHRMHCRYRLPPLGCLNGRWARLFGDGSDDVHPVQADRGGQALSA